MRVGLPPRARWDDERDLLCGLALQSGNGIRTERDRETAAPELALPVGECHVPDEEHRTAVPGRPWLGRDPGHAQVGRERRVGREMGVHTRGERGERLLGLGSQRLELTLSGGAQAAPAGEHVEAEGSTTRDFGPPAVGPSAVVLELTQPILGLHEPLGHEGIAGGGCACVRDAPVVPVDDDLAVQPGDRDVHHLRTLRRARRASCHIRPTCDHRGVHEDVIRRARRRIRLVTAAGLLVLVLTMSAIVFPVAWILGALSNPLDTGLGYGWDLAVWAGWISLAFGVIVAGGTFTWSLFHAEARVLDFVRAWPGPRAGPNPPPRLPEGALERAERLLTGLGLAAGVHAPRVAVVIDDAPNCLTVGRRPDAAWIVVTTGLLDTLPKRELEAVLAYEIGRVVELEVSLDTVVYALTSRTFELWAAAFSDLDHASLLLAPLGLVSLPFVFVCVILRAGVLRTRARLADGLAVRYCRNPVALARGLRRILEDPREVRRGDPANAHLWLEYPHTRASKLFLRTHRILPKRVRRLERASGLG